MSEFLHMLGGPPGIFQCGCRHCRRLCFSPFRIALSIVLKVFCDVQVAHSDHSVRLLLVDSGDVGGEGGGLHLFSSS